MQYRVGDKVLIRNDLVSKRVYSGITFAPEMSEYKGKIATIVDIQIYYEHHPLPGYRYKFDIDDKRWFWIDDFLQPSYTDELKLFLKGINNEV